MSMLERGGLFKKSNLARHKRWFLPLNNSWKIWRGSAAMQYAFPIRFSIMGIDPTFNLGNVFVTVTTYKHLMVKRKSNNEHPVFIGPSFIYMQQETQTYFSCLSSLIGKKNDLRDLKAYGSDGEVTLLNALVAAFPDAIGLRCFIHMKDDIEDHLRTSNLK